MIALGDRTEGAWKPPIVKTVAHRGEGVDELVAEIDRHFAWLRESGRAGAAAHPPRARRDRDHRRHRAAPPVGRRPRPRRARRPRGGRGRRASPTRTPPRTPCWRTSSEGRSRSRFRHRGHPPWELRPDVPNLLRVTTIGGDGRRTVDSWGRTSRFDVDGRRVLDDASRSRPSPGRMLAVTGSSGSGKTTLLSLVGGLAEPATGDRVVRRRAGDHQAGRAAARHRLRAAELRAGADADGGRERLHRPARSRRRPDRGHREGRRGARPGRRRRARRPADLRALRRSAPARRRGSRARRRGRRAARRRADQRARRGQPRRRRRPAADGGQPRGGGAGRHPRPGGRGGVRRRDPPRRRPDRGPGRAAPAARAGPRARHLHAAGSDTDDRRQRCVSTSSTGGGHHRPGHAGIAVRCQNVVHIYTTVAGHDVVALRGVNLDIAPGEQVALPRPVGLGQVHAAGPVRRPPARLGRQGDRRRHRHQPDPRGRADPAAGRQGRLASPGRPPQPADLRHRRRQRRVRPARHGGGRRTPAAVPPPAAGDARARRAHRQARSTRCRAASSSGWPWRSRSPAAPGCCWPTSRPPSSATPTATRWSTSSSG